MGKIRILRDVGKDGRYSIAYSIKRIDWLVCGKKTIKYRALCISIRTYDIIICYRKAKS